jgi:hypothetical protein
MSKVDCFLSFRKPMHITRRAHGHRLCSVRRVVDGSQEQK